MSDQSDSAALEAAAAQVDADLTADDNTITGLQQQLATSQAALAAETTKDQTDEATVASLQAEVAALQAQLAGSTVPGPPMSLTATAGDTSVVLTWAAPVTGGAATDYSVTTTPGGVITDVRTTLTATVSGLTNGTAYTFAVTPSNAAGSGPYAAATVTPSAPVNPPINPVTSRVLPVFSSTPGGIANYYTKLSPTAALDPQSTTKAAAINKAVAALYSGWTANRNLSAPTYTEVDGSKVAKVSVKVVGFSGSPTGTFSISIPASAVPDPSSGDHGMVVVDTFDGTVTEMWEAVKGGTATSPTWQCDTAGQANSLTSNGIFQWGPLFHSEAASDISYAATMVKPSDLASGVIAHVLAIVLPDTSGQFQAPAIHADGNTKGGINEGTYVRLPANVTFASGLPPAALMVGVALRDYGGVVVDSAGAGAVVFANPASWAAPDPYTPYLAGKQDYQLLSGLPWSQLQVLAPPTS